MQTNYENKTFMYDEDGPGLYTIMGVRFEANENDALNKAGWRGDYIVWLVLGSDIRYATREWRNIERQLTDVDDDHLAKLFQSIDYDGNWDKLEDGERYTPGKIDEVFGE